MADNPAGQPAVGRQRRFGRDKGTTNVISGGTFYGSVIMGGVIISGPMPGSLPFPSVIPGQLPAAAPGFTGRAAELAAVLSGLEPATGADTAPVAAIAGVAGVGKTELAIQAGHAAVARGWFPGGVIFLSLHGYDDQPMTGAQALDSALRALGVGAEDIPSGPEERAACYRSKLAASGPVLIVADNASAAEQVSLLRPGDTRHRMLVTSRHTLPQIGARLIDLTVLAESDAVALLDAALLLADRQDTRVKTQQPAALSLAKLCGYLPLALQISAAILAHDAARPVAELATELEDERSRLGRLNDQHRSVISVFELSYRRLDPQSARLFRLLTVNPGSDLATRAAAVLADAAETETRQALDGLAAAHLIERAAIRGRWRMHDLMRVYAQRRAEEAADADGSDAAFDRLAGYYLEEAESANDRLQVDAGDHALERFPSRADALAWLEVERLNLVASTTHASAAGRDQLASRLALCLVTFLSARFHANDLLAVTEAGQKAAHNLGEHTDEIMLLISLNAALRIARRFDEAAAACHRARHLCGLAGDRVGEGRALTALGAVLAEMRRFDDALAACQQAEEILHAEDSQTDEGLVLNNHGLVLFELRRYPEALPLCRRAAEKLRGSGDMAAFALNNLASTLIGLNEPEEAVVLFGDAAAIVQESGNLALEALTLINLAGALSEVKQHGEALATAMRAIALCEKTGDRHKEGHARLSLDRIRYSMHDDEAALAAGREAACIFRETGDRHMYATALHSIGLTLKRLKKSEDAMGCLADSASIYQETGDHRSAGIVFDDLGGILREARRYVPSATAYLQAAALLWEVGEDRRERSALDDLGKVLKKSGRFKPDDLLQATGGYPDACVTQVELGLGLARLKRFDGALVLYQRVIEKCRDSRNRRMEGVALACLASALLGLERNAEAIEFSQQAVAIARETEVKRDEASALTELGLCLEAVQRNDEAITAHRASVEIYQAIGSAYLQARATASLGMSLLGALRLTEAIHTLAQAADLCHQAAQETEAPARTGLAFCLLQEHRYDEAIAAAREAARQFAARDDYRGIFVASRIRWNAAYRRFRESVSRKG